MKKLCNGTHISELVWLRNKKCHCFGVRFSAAIAEMLVQSTTKDLYLLPALPRDKWANGCVKGLKARGGVTVNIYWKEGDLHEVGLWSQNQNSTLRLHYRGTMVAANLSPGRVYSYNNRLKCVRTYSLSQVNPWIFFFPNFPQKKKELCKGHALLFAIWCWIHDFLVSYDYSPRVI